MVPLHALHNKACGRRAALEESAHDHSHAPAPAPAPAPTAVLYARRRKAQCSPCSDAPRRRPAAREKGVARASPSPSPLHESPPRARASEARLTNCELLIGVLECYMSLQLQRADAAEARGVARGVARAPKQEPSLFQALHTPPITAAEYLRRLARYAFCSRSAFILAFLYVRKVCGAAEAGQARQAAQAAQAAAGGRPTVNALSIHRLLLTATLLATKMVDDVLYDNAHFAKVGGLDIKELNALELHMLHALRFDLCVSAEQFESFERSVLADVLASDDAAFCTLRERLRNMGYAAREALPPCSPVSSLDELPASHA